MRSLDFAFPLLHCTPQASDQFERIPLNSNNASAQCPAQHLLEQDLSCNPMATQNTTRPDGDMSWKEVGELGLRYGRIPLALIFVKMFYWFLTIPSDTLAPIQVTEAWLWNELTNFLYGEGSSVISHHNGWLTRIDFVHPSFPGPFDTVGLYVSDECAGVHEMIFISTLVMMTDGMSQRFKLKSVVVMCSIVYVINLMRLVAFYPIALEACIANPDQQACLVNMWTFHQYVYEWGFLIVLVLMWMVWFFKFGGPEGTLEAAKGSNDSWRISRRTNWGPKHWTILAFAALFVVLALSNITTNEEAIEAKQTLDVCEFSNLISAECGNAQMRWDDAIGYAWSLSAISMVMVGGTALVIQRPDEFGNWPEPASAKAAEPSKEKGHYKKKSGSWNKRSGQEEE